MKSSIKAIEQKNWALVIIGSIVFLLGLALVAVSIIFWKDFGWWSLALFASGISSVVFSTLAIKQNKAELLMLDLLLPK